MKKALGIILSMVFTLGIAGTAVASSNGDVCRPAVANGSSAFEQQLSGEVRHQLAMIPQFTVFDNLAYRVDGGTVVLYGEVRNAVIKDVAEKSVKRLEGVERVENKIEVLPASFNDDRIRRQVARAMFRDARLSNYAIQPVPPIHIIVKNGHVNLEGVVRTQTDKDDAFIRANGVAGVFSVQNNLKVEQSKS